MYILNPSILLTLLTLIPTILSHPLQPPTLSPRSQPTTVRIYYQDPPAPGVAKYYSEFQLKIPISFWPTRREVERTIMSLMTHLEKTATPQVLGAFKFDPDGAVMATDWVIVGYMVKNRRYEFLEGWRKPMGGRMDGAEIKPAYMEFPHLRFNPV